MMLRATLVHVISSKDGYILWNWNLEAGALGQPWTTGHTTRGCVMACAVPSGRWDGPVATASVMMPLSMRNFVKFLLILPSFQEPVAMIWD